MQTHLVSVQSFVPNLIITEHSDRLYCSICANSFIPRPPEASLLTRFTCRNCCAALLRARDPHAAATVTAIFEEVDKRLDISNGSDL